MEYFNPGFVRRALMFISGKMPDKVYNNKKKMSGGGWGGACPLKHFGTSPLKL